MADFAFYTDVYLGSQIPAKAFGEFALRAKEELERLQRNYRVVSSGDESLGMAICAMAESLYAHSKRRSGVVAATMGETSVRYEQGKSAERSLTHELYRKASIYLDISRGVGE